MPTSPVGETTVPPPPGKRKAALSKLVLTGIVSVTISEIVLEVTEVFVTVKVKVRICPGATFNGLTVF